MADPYAAFSVAEDAGAPPPSTGGVDPYAAFSVAEESETQQAAPTAADLASTEKSALNEVKRPMQRNVEDIIAEEKHKVSSELGGPVEFEKTHASKTMRLDVGASTNLEEVAAKIKNYEGFEGSNVKQVGEDYYIQKDGKGGIWTPVNVTGPDAGDLSEFASKYGPQMAGSLATLAFTGPTGLAFNVLKAGAGGAMGFLAGQGVEEARGFQFDPASQVGIQALKAGGEEMAGQTIGEGVGRLVSGVVGRGTTRMEPDQLEVVRALRDADAVPTPGMIGRSPIRKQMESYYSKLSTASSERMRKNLEKIAQYREVLKGRLGTPESLEAGRILREVHAPRIVKNLRESMDSTVRDFFGEGAKGLRATGRGIKEGLEAFRTRIQGVKDGLYTNMKALADDLGEEMNVDVTNLQKGVGGLADEVLAKVKGGGRRPATLQQQLAGEKPASMQKVKDIAQTPQDSQLKELIEDITILDGAQPFEVVDRLIKNANSILRKDALTPNDGRITQEIKKLLDNSLDADVLISHPELKSAYTRARNYAKGRAKVLQNDYIRHISKTWEPAKLVKELARSGELDTLLLARKSMPKKKWADFRIQVQQACLTFLIQF